MNSEIDSPDKQAKIDREQWKEIDLNRVLIWINIAITLIGLASLFDELRFWHDQVLVPAGVWLRAYFPIALIPFQLVYVVVEGWRWVIHGFFDLVSIDLPRTFQSIIAIYILLCNGTLLFLRGRVSATGRVPYARIEFLKGIFLQLFYVRTILKWLLAKPRWHEEYIKYFIDAILCIVIWATVVVSVVAPFFGQFDVAKWAVLLTIISIYTIILSDGLYFGRTRWYTVIFLCSVASMYVVDSVYSVCCV